MSMKLSAVLKFVFAALFFLSENGFCGTLLPPPQQVIGGGTLAALSTSAEISASNNSPETTFLIGYIGSALSAGGISVGGGSSPVKIYFHIFGDAAPLLGLPVGPFAAIGEEGYALSVANDAGNVRIVVGANTQHGLFNGGMTVLQLLLTDSGPKELYITPQLIRDYPDKPVRAGYLFSAQLTYDSSTQKYIFGPDAAKRVDQLARIKFNTLYGTNWYQIMDATAWNASKDSFAALQRYCHERFIEYVPIVGSVSSSADIDHRDGWWIHDEPFHFQPTESTFLFNGNFNSDIEKDGVPDGWSVSTIGATDGAWTLDTSLSNPSPGSGGPKMRLDLANNPVASTAANSSNQLTLTQTVGVPGPGTYAVEAWVNADGLQGQAFQVTVYGVKTDVTPNTNTLPASLWVNPNQQLGWTHQLSTQRLTVAAGDGVTKFVVYARVQEPGYGTVYVDDIRLVRMNQQPDGSWVKEPTMVVQEAVADIVSTNLVANGGLELDANGDAIPDGWVVAGTPSDPNGAWQRDNVEKHSGAYSMRLDLANYPDSGYGSNGITLSQEVRLPTSSTGVPLSGHYLLTAWTKTSSVSAVQPQVSFYTSAIPGSQVPQIQQSILLSTGTSGWAQHGALLVVPENNTAYDRLTIYARIQEPGVGTFWVDDISIRRIDGDLRNVMRRTYDIQVTSMDGVTAYQQGSDYDVIDGEQISLYKSNMNSTRIRRRDGGAIPSDAKVRISYDQNLYYSDTGNFSANLCTSQTLDELYKPALQRALVELPQLTNIPVSSINLSSDEVRGMNRSGACRNADGSYKLTNAELLANFFNDLIGYSKNIKPALRFDAWDDMFSPVHNGGQDYQLNYGGPGGKTVCAVDPSFCTPALPVTPIVNDLSMLTWWYNPNYLYQMNAASSFFAKQGRSLLMSPWYDETNIRDWAALSVATPASRGMLATAWGDVGAPTSEVWVPLVTSLGWNAEWMQIFYAPFEASSQADLEATGYSFSNAKQTSDRSCAVVSSSYLPQINSGGVCMSAGGAVTLPLIPVDNSSSYQVVLEKSLKNASLSGIVYWQDAGHKLISTTPLVFGVAAASDLGIGSSPNFWRANSDLTVPPNSVSTFMQVQITSSSAVNIDNVMVRRSLAGCPDGRVVLTAPQVNLGVLPANTPYAATIVVRNTGCEDLKITNIISAYSGALDFSAVMLPIIVPAGTSISLTGRGAALSSGSTLTLPVYLESNSDLNGFETVNVLVSAKPSVSLAVTKIGSGTVTSTPVGINCGTTCTADFDANTAVTLTATAANDSLFGSWSGCDSTSANTCTIIMSTSKSVSASFSGVPDLVEASLGVTASGTAFLISDQITNSGIGAAGTFDISYYLSTNPTYEAGTDLLLCKRTINSLAANTTETTVQTSCAIPSVAAGNYYVLARVDSGNTVSEFNEVNNTSTAAVALSGIDLLPLNTSAARVSGSNTKVTVNEIVKNQGNKNAGSFTIRYYLSTNTTYESTDIPLASSSNGTGACNRTRSSLNAGTSNAVSGKTCYKPSGVVAGVTYNVLVVDDWGSTFPGGGIIEYNEANNVSVAGTVKW